MINVEKTLLKTHFNLMLISLKCDQVTILDRNTCKTYNVSYLIIQRYFRQYIIWDLTTATLNNLLDFFLNLFICARYFFSLFFSCANFFLIFAQPSPQKFNGPSLNKCFQVAKQTLLALIMQKTDVPRRKKNFARKL